MDKYIKFNNFREIVYNEGSICTIIGLFGAYKFRMMENIILDMINCGVYIRKARIWNKVYFNVSSALHNVVIQLGIGVRNVSIGYYNRFKVIGLGQRMYYSSNVYIMELGYSHLVYYTLPLNVMGWKKKHKKQKFFVLFSSSATVVNKEICNIQNHRIPDVFSMNGIYKRSDDLEWKEGKKAFGFML